MYAIRISVHIRARARVAFHASGRTRQGEVVDGAFVDGGVSPFNDTALQLLMLATLQGHGFRWQIIEVRRMRPSALTTTSRSGDAMRVDDRSRPIAGPTQRRSRRLDAIKGFALGE